MLAEATADPSGVFIKFQHINTGEDKRTVCRIVQKTPDGMAITMSEGVARCNSKDVYAKKIGRLIALERAVEVYPKSIRSAIWETYWNRKNNSRMEVNGI